MVMMLRISGCNASMDITCGEGERNTLGSEGLSSRGSQCKRTK